MEQYRSYTDPQDENDVTNKRYVDKNIDDRIKKVENDIDDMFKKSLGKIVVDDIRGKNLFDINGNIINNSTSVLSVTKQNNGVYITCTSTISGLATISLPIVDVSKYAGKRVTLSYTKNSDINSQGAKLEIYTGSISRSIDIIDQNIYAEEYSFNVPSTITDENKYLWIKVVIRAGYVVANKYLSINNIQIEEGSQATNYSEYKKYGYNSVDSMGKIVVDDIRGKNLFNKRNPWTKGWLRYNDGLVMNDGFSTFGFTDYIEVKPSTEYTINFYDDLSLHSGGIIQYNNSKEMIGAGIAETQKIITFTTLQSTKYIRFTFRQDAIDNIQLEEGPKATSFSEYKIFGFDDLKYKEGDSNILKNLKIENDGSLVLMVIGIIGTLGRFKDVWLYGTYQQGTAERAQINKLWESGYLQYTIDGKSLIISSTREDSQPYHYQITMLSGSSHSLKISVLDR